MIRESYGIESFNPFFLECLIFYCWIWGQLILIIGINLSLVC